MPGVPDMCDQIRKGDEALTVMHASSLAADLASDDPLLHIAMKKQSTHSQDSGKKREANALRPITWKSESLHDTPLTDS